MSDELPDKLRLLTNPEPHNLFVDDHGEGPETAVFLDDLELRHLKSYSISRVAGEMAVATLEIYVNTPIQVRTHEG